MVQLSSSTKIDYITVVSINEIACSYTGSAFTNHSTFALVQVRVTMLTMDCSFAMRQMALSLISISLRLCLRQQ